ncbi:radical SAM protein [Thermosipho atlanticus]|uniref:Radical SAM superfamily enzyme, MoaA/NifB/PqqE/SkfB family n=1 Tax=Thermosipho atlanticus DSM 15807 TaxID=1123380 RepID=A0A1M5QT93_9BACT|nr:radical SAM protein [Thermosipho atlanticus]SHH16990.1 Radical SAM superfamily enzyme, MoaA/NifB/PqqE/SkfB family [Thermosipho atlanticus DSM 15807]
MAVGGVKGIIYRQAGKIVNSVIRKADTKTFAKLLFTVAALSKEPAKSGLKKIGLMAEEEHPMIKKWIEIFRNSSPKCTEKIINNLIINEFAIGEPMRQKIMEREKVVLPKLGVISPTYACNIECIGCYAGLYGRKYELSKDEVRSVLKQGEELGIYFWVITGGEPFYWPHIFEILEEFDQHYFMIYSNGILITEERAKKLAELGNATIAISVEGFEEQTDWRRGKGVYKAILNAWERLRRYGVPFGASVTATKVNHDTIMKDEFWDFLEQNGVGYVWIYQFMPVGINPTMDLVPSPKQRYERFFKTDEMRLSGRFAFVADFWNHGFLTHGCLSAGSKYFHVNAKGYVEPCVFQQFAKDSIREKTLLEIFKSPFFEAYKKMIPFSNNLFRPCPIIDNPKVFRAMVKHFDAIPQHEGSERVINELAPELDKLAEEWKQYADKLWYEHGYVERYPVNRGIYNYETRMKRYANKEEALKVDKKLNI